MSIAKCLLEATTAIKNAEGIEAEDKTAILSAMQRVIEDTGKSDERKLAAAIFAAREARKDMYISKVTALADENKQVALAAMAEKLPLDQQLTYLRNHIEADWSYADRNAPAVSNLARAEEERAASRLGEVWDNISEGLLGRDTAMAASVHKELLGIDTGNNQAKMLADKVRKVYDEYNERMGATGVYIPNRENRVKQSHGVAKINSNLAAWQKFLREKLDPAYHPDPDASIARIYESLTTRHLSDQESPTITMMRQVWWKDPQDEFDYFYQFGEGSFGEVMMADIRTLARKTVLAEQLGPTPSRNFEAVAKPIAKRIAKAAAEAESRGDKKAAKALRAEEGKAATAEMTLKSLTGELHNPADQQIAHWGASARNWMIFQMLGKVPLSIVGQDMWNTVFQNRFHTGGFASSFGQTFRTMAEVARTTPETRAYLEEMGVWFHALSAASVDRFSSVYAGAEVARSGSRKLATATQRLSGVYLLDQKLRSATMLVMSRGLYRNLSQNGWGDLHPKYQKALRANGIDEAKWKKLRKSAKAYEGTNALDVNKLPRAERDLVMAFLFREMDLAVVHPQHYDRALMTFGAQAGTIPGEAAAMMTQFWSWPIAFLRGPVRREWAMGGSGFVGFSAGMVLAGAATTQLYAAAENQPVYEWDSPTLWKRAIARSGLLSPIGELLLEAASGQGTDVGGPVTSVALRTVGQFGMGAMDIIDGDTDRAARRMAQVTQQLFVPNMWHTQYALTSRTMDALMWQLDPAYMRDRQRRFREEGRDL